MGKTGTAEVKKHHKDEDEQATSRSWNPNASHAWFAGWAPAEDPEIAIVVLVEHGGAGGTVAWPIAQQHPRGLLHQDRTAPSRSSRRAAPAAKRGAR